jgi:hypothetical protein
MIPCAMISCEDNHRTSPPQEDNPQPVGGVSYLPAGNVPTCIYITSKIETFAQSNKQTRARPILDDMEQREQRI